jgi:hypothetical protein
VLFIRCYLYSFFASLFHHLQLLGVCGRLFDVDLTTSSSSPFFLLHSFLFRGLIKAGAAGGGADARRQLEPIRGGLPMGESARLLPRLPKGPISLVIPLCALTACVYLWMCVCVCIYVIFSLAKSSQTKQNKTKQKHNQVDLLPGEVIVSVHVPLADQSSFEFVQPYKQV